MSIRHRAERHLPACSPHSGDGPAARSQRLRRSHRGAPRTSADIARRRGLWLASILLPMGLTCVRVRKSTPDRNPLTVRRRH